MSKLSVGGLNFSSNEMTWMAAAVTMIVVFGYLLTTGIRLG